MVDGNTKTLDRNNRSDVLSDNATLAAVLFDLSSDAVVAVDKAQAIVAYSQAAAQMFGYAADEVIGRPLAMLLPREAVERHQLLVDQFARTATPTRLMGNRGEIRGRRKNGEDFPAEASIARMELGDETVLVAVLRDITERKSSERALESSQRLRELILNSAGEGIYGLDANGHTTFVNPTAAEILGWEPEELLGKPQHDIIHHTRPDGSPYPARECPIYAAFSDGAVHRVDDEVFWRKDGTSLPVEYVSTPIRDDEGNLAGAVVTFVDITDRKRQQEALERALTEVRELKDRLQQENLYLQQEIQVNHNFEQIIGSSKALAKTLARLEQVAGTDTTVLITGETGVGKELFARSIHHLSPRNGRPLVKVNCAALPSTLIESELFGHERGAFTGATTQRIGRFELAHGGTIFLDEIGELPLELQAKLLRVIQEGELERIGGSRTITVDVRIIAATNRDLTKAVWAGEFRDDLYYRLNVFPVEVPPLRERKEDIPQLVTHFVRKHSAKLGKDITSIPDHVQSALEHYEWAGNVRELENIIERCVILSNDATLRVDEALEMRPPDLHAATDRRTLEAVERDHIVGVLEQTGWRIEGDGGAADILAIHANTLRSRMKKLGIEKHVSTA
jgi:PAS domain S-box-containing protein